MGLPATPCAIVVAAALTYCFRYSSVIPSSSSLNVHKGRGHVCIAVFDIEWVLNKRTLKNDLMI